MRPAPVPPPPRRVAAAVGRVPRARPWDAGAKVRCGDLPAAGLVADVTGGTRSPAMISSFSPLDLEDKFVGSLLGGAIGDALGFPAENLSRQRILARFG